MRRSLTILALALAACSGGDSGDLGGELLCGTRTIRGAEAEPITSSIKACGLDDGVRVTSVDGVRLTRAATMDCTTAKALDEWVQDGVKPAFGRKGGGVEALVVYASYSCRPRNNIPGARISEHGKGRAIDVGGFVLGDGTQVSVLTGWRSKTYGKTLQRIHAAACGPFGTVLGPKSDVFHQNHFHMDTARYRSGAYCR